VAPGKLTSRCAHRPSKPLRGSRYFSPSKRGISYRPLRPVLLQERDEVSTQEWDQLTSSEYPFVSVIVVAEATISTHQACIATVLSSTDYPSYELLVLDDETDAERTAWLGSLVGEDHHVRALQVDAGSGRGALIDRALTAAKGQIIVFLDDDTIVAPGWLTRLTNHLADSTVGLVGPGTNRSSSEAMIEIAYDDAERFVQFAQQQAIDHDGEQTPVRVVPLFCAAARRDVIKRIGPLDDRYQGAMFQAEDYALRLKAAGYTLAWARDVFVHRAGTTPLVEQDASVASLLAADQRLFEAKWGVRWEPDRPTPETRTIPVVCTRPGAAFQTVIGDHLVLSGWAMAPAGVRSIDAIVDGAWRQRLRTACHQAGQISRVRIPTTRILSPADSKALSRSREWPRAGTRLSFASRHSITGRSTLSFPLKSTRRQRRVVASWRLSTVRSPDSGPSSPKVTSRYAVGHCLQMGSRTLKR
jgi:cellulose synthase/poly-beta-1,6-N-acetylglucosamine synthase-like glycosyltransferase